MELVIQQEVIEGKIYMIRGHKVMLSTDLAELYEVEPRVLVQAVKRNIERFPADFMFQLNDKEFNNLKSQIVTSSWGGLRRATPYAFTEQGVAMLSGVEERRGRVIMRGISEARDTDLKVIERLQQICWPKARLERDEYLKVICAFANVGGGMQGISISR